MSLLSPPYFFTPSTAATTASHHVMATSATPLTISSSRLTTVNNTLLSLPNPLRDSLTASLFTSSPSIPNIQEAFTSSISSSGFGVTLQKFIVDIFRQDTDNALGEAQVLNLVLQKIRESVESQARAQKGVETGSLSNDGLRGDSLEVPGSVMMAGSRAVRKEFDRIGVTVEDDEEDWK
jgi:hypothetical protein